MPEDECINLLKNVNAKTYTRNDMTNSKRRCGYIAQDIEEHAHISLGENLVGTSTYSKNKDDDKPIEIKTLSYDRVGSPILWTVCKQLLKRIEALEDKLNSS